NSIEDVPVLEVPALDLEAIAVEDEQRESGGLAPRFAIPFPVSVTPDNSGIWEAVDDKNLMWRQRVLAPEAVSINLGFTRYFMPQGGRMLVYSMDQKSVLGPFTAENNESHGEFWSPLLLTNEVVIEVTIPNAGINVLDLELTQVNSGYRGFGAKRGGGAKSGSCNVDVVCPEGNGWQGEIGSVGVISTGGSLFCTGFMVNNTANDRTPYFMTANHCGISSGNAASLVVYWNYETSICGGTPNGSLSDVQVGGSYFRAGYSNSDFTLVELVNDPQSSWEVSFSGWDRSAANASTAVAIHHPNCDEKRISFEYQSTSRTAYLGTTVPGDGTHVRVTDWDIGTTEPGSSGSPLFDQNHRVIGQLHGGYAACGNNDSDWYGAFAVSWTGGGSNTTRLSNWLDPGSTGATTVDTLGQGLSVNPSGAVAHDGPILGPFTNPTTTYTLTNQTTAALSYRVSLGGNVGLLLNGGAGPVTGTLPGSGTAQFVVTLSSAVNLLGVGEYLENVLVEDLTNLLFSTIPHTFKIGSGVAATFNMDTNPGWTTQGQWAFGVPQGGGGQYGNPDPTSGHTGSNVYGYNLAGDYANNLPQYHLTSLPIDCSTLTGVELSFWRWLNVETPSYDHAKLAVSNNGSTWTTLFENSGEITDSSWSQQSYDISSVADGRSTVYLRWTMGVTDGSWQYSGWNIDDVVLEGVNSFTQYGSGCPGSGGLIPELSGSGNASPGGSVTIQVQKAKASGYGLMLLSVTPGNSTISGCSYLVGPSIVPAVGIGLNSSGAASIPATLPGTFPVGLGLFMQFVSIDAGAANGKWAVSNGLELLVQ
ncbi:MAG: trypsin-like peptidase domain-containing protein, partial [Planctomycetota bacterium]